MADGVVAVAADAAVKDSTDLGVAEHITAQVEAEVDPLAVVFGLCFGVYFFLIYNQRAAAENKTAETKRRKKLCAVCGRKAKLRCSKCSSVRYCE